MIVIGLQNAGHQWDSCGTGESCIGHIYYTKNVLGLKETRETEIEIYEFIFENVFPMKSKLTAVRQCSIEISY